MRSNRPYCSGWMRPDRRGAVDNDHGQLVGRRPVTARLSLWFVAKTPW
jgi:hypothetical protein